MESFHLTENMIFRMFLFTRHNVEAFLFFLFFHFTHSSPEIACKHQQKSLLKPKGTVGTLYSIFTTNTVFSLLSLVASHLGHSVSGAEACSVSSEDTVLVGAVQVIW